jgi:hypothetical protein
MHGGDGDDMMYILVVAMAYKLLIAFIIEKISYLTLP